MTRLSKRWGGRVGGGVALAGIGYAIAVWLDFEPQPLPYVLWAVVAITTTYLVIDTADAPTSHWQHAVSTRSDRVDEVTSDLRVLSSHQQADHPSDALAQRLVGLARGRGGPGLAAEIEHELTDRGQITPADVDRILTRIEESRDR